MKKYLLATTAAGAVMALATPAQADAYVTVFGGTNYLDDQPLDLASATVTNYPWIANYPSYASWTRSAFFFGTNVEVDDGYVVGAALGMGLDDYVPGLSVEIELAKRSNDAKLESGVAWTYAETCCDTFPWSTGATTGVNAGQVNALSVMANVWYEFDVDFAVHPYVGGGIGVAAVTYQSHTGLREMEKNSFAYQLAAGIAIDLNECLRLGIEYRYFDAPDAEFTAPGQPDGVPFDYNVQNVIIGLKYSF